MVASTSDLPLQVQILGELDDENRVLGGKTDDGDQADGEIDVVRQAPQHRGSDCTNTPSSSVSSTASGMVQLLVESGETQEYHHHREREQERRHRARQLFLQGLTSPFMEARHRGCRTPLARSGP
jgi:hypothetical protein